MTRPERALVAVLAGLVPFFSPLVLWVAGLHPPWWLVFVVWGGWIALIAWIVRPAEPGDSGGNNPPGRGRDRTDATKNHTQNTVGLEPDDAECDDAGLDATADDNLRR